MNEILVIPAANENKELFVISTADIDIDRSSTVTIEMPFDMSYCTYTFIGITVTNCNITADTANNCIHIKNYNDTDDAMIPNDTVICAFEFDADEGPAIPTTTFIPTSIGDVTIIPKTPNSYLTDITYTQGLVDNRQDIGYVQHYPEA